MFCEKLLCGGLSTNVEACVVVIRGNRAPLLSTPLGQREFSSDLIRTVSEVALLRARGAISTDHPTHSRHKVHASPTLFSPHTFAFSSPASSQNYQSRHQLHLCAVPLSSSYESAVILQLALLAALYHSKPPIMSDYVFPTEQEAPFDYGWDTAFSLDQYIDPALLDLQALETDHDGRGVGSAAPGSSTFKADRQG